VRQKFFLNYYDYKIKYITIKFQKQKKQTNYCYSNRTNLNDFEFDELNQILQT